VYVGNREGRFFAVDALSGALTWSYDTDGEIMGSANHIDAPGGGKNHVLVGSYDTKMYCLDADTGALVWSYETDYYINGAPATDGVHVVFGGCDASLHIVSTADGTKIGEVPVGSYIAGSAALVDGMAYVGHYGGSLVAVDIDGKTVAWDYRQEEHGGGFFSSPAVGSGHIYIGSRDRHVHCVDRTTGKLVWKFRTRGEVDSSPVIAGNGDRIVFGSADGRMYMVGAGDGAEIWSYEIGSPIIGSPAVAGGMIVIGVQDGRLYAFGEER
jgi:outer membrane protein assembly factor BamB